MSCVKPCNVWCRAPRVPESAPPLPEQVFQDDCLLVLNKPAGLLSVPGRGPDKQDCLSARVQAVYPDAQIVHRLDQATSGLLLMARGPQYQRQLSAAFAGRNVEKTYLAQVAGDCRHAATWQLIDLPIGQHWPDRPRRHIASNGGQPSQTRWRCLHFDARQQASLLELQPLTGRTHQLRLHLQAIGHPIWGDALYAPEAVARASPRLLLHAWRLQLHHPLTGETVAWEAPCEFAGLR